MRTNVFSGLNEHRNSVNVCWFRALSANLLTIFYLYYYNFYLSAIVGSLKVAEM